MLDLAWLGLWLRFVNSGENMNIMPTLNKAKDISDDAVRTMEVLSGDRQALWSVLTALPVYINKV